MKDIEFVENIKNEILAEAFNYYFNSLATPVSGPDKYWKNSKELYSSLDSEQKDKLKIFTRLVMIDTISSIFGKLDNISSYSNQEGMFELTINGNVISGDLQDIFLAEIE
jgi:hypothetical protein